MIYIFRKEIKKWHIILWIVFIAFAISGVSFWRQRGTGEFVIGTVNKKNIYVKQYKRMVNNITLKLNFIKPYAKLFGLAEEALIFDMLGGRSLEESAFYMCVREKLLDDIKSHFNLNISDEIFQKELVKLIPPETTDEKGYINMDAYNNYLSRLSTTAYDFEEDKREELKRNIIQKLISNSLYIPKFELEEAFEIENSKRKFEITKVAFSSFFNSVSNEKIDEEKLKVFFEQKKESYKIPERCILRYWEITPDLLIKQVEVTDEMIKNFYDKNKTKMFWIAPKVSLRHILFKASPKTEATTRKKAEEIYKKIKEQPSKFAEFAKQYSDNAKTAKNGGFVNLFNKGTYEHAFEQEAFKLIEPNDISPVFKASNGYEIIQLVERQKSKGKPIENVKNEIIKILKSKKATMNLHAELEAVMRKMREDETAIDVFIKKNALSEKESNWITKNTATTMSIDSVFSQKIFSKVARNKTYGYLMHGDKYVVYVLKKREQERIPTLKEVRQKVTDSYMEHKCIEKVKDIVKKIKTDVLQNKISFKAAAQKLGIDIVETDFITKDAKEIKGLDKNSTLIHNLLDRMFAMLTDKSLILEHRDKNDYFLGQLVESKPIDQQINFVNKKDEILKRKKTNDASTNFYTNVFLPAVERCATIVIDKNKLSKFSV